MESHDRRVEAITLRALQPIGMRCLDSRRYMCCLWYTNPSNLVRSVRELVDSRIISIFTSDKSGQSFCFSLCILLNLKYNTCNMLDSYKQYIRGDKAIIPEGTSIIDDDAFKGCAEITSVTIPDGVKVVGSHAFEGCSGLTKIRTPESCRNIGPSAFMDCTSLEYVSVSNRILIGKSAFEGCSSLSAIRLPNLTWITARCFARCSSLTKIVIPEGVLSIKEEAFMDCDNLISLDISTSLGEISQNAFSGCINLSEISIYPGDRLSIEQNAFHGCNNIKRFNILSDYASYERAQDVIIDILDTIPLIQDDGIAIHVPNGAYNKCSVLPFFRYLDVVEDANCSSNQQVTEEVFRIPLYYTDDVNTIRRRYNYYEGLYHDAFENDSEAEWGIRD